MVDKNPPANAGDMGLIPGPGRSHLESPDAIVPVGENAYTIMRYSQNNNSAAVAYSGAYYRSVVCGFPFETLATEAMQQQFMQQIIDFLTK